MEQETWIEKTYYTTEETFPTVLRRSEVVDTASIEISPLEHAFSEVEQKTKKLATLERKYSSIAKTGQAISTNALSMTLNAVVDAPTEEGVPYYRDIFLSLDYVDRHPDRAELVQKLRESIDEQVTLIITCSLLTGTDLGCRPEFLTSVSSFMARSVLRRCFRSMRHWSVSFKRIFLRRSYVSRRSQLHTLGRSQMRLARQALRVLHIHGCLRPIIVPLPKAADSLANLQNPQFLAGQ